MDMFHVLRINKQEEKLHRSPDKRRRGQEGAEYAKKKHLAEERGIRSSLMT
jgi:hypothetical protein